MKEIIAADVPIAPAGENRISIGEHQIPCTGTRTHVKRSGQIERFRLLKEFRYHPIFREHMLVGTVGTTSPRATRRSAGCLCCDGGARGREQSRAGGPRWTTCAG